MKAKIIYEDLDVIVCHKPAGLATQTNQLGQVDVVSELKNYRKQQQSDSEPYIGLVHRLDQPVEGLLVIGKNPGATKKLSEQIAQNKIEKGYYALLEKTPEPKEGILEDYLLKDGRTNLSKVVAAGTKEAKYAKLSYKTIENNLVDIHIKTGRHHQIRLQMAAHGMSLMGDLKYGSNSCQEQSVKAGIKNVALCAYSLSFLHPTSGKKMEFSICPENFPCDYFKRG